MPGNLSMTIGTNTVTLPLKLTNTQLQAAVKRYAIARGIETEGRTAAAIGEDVLRSLVRYMRDVSLDRQREELVDAQMAAISATIASDNDLFDEPAEPLP